MNIQKIKVRIVVRLVHLLLKGSFTDTRAPQHERILRWVSVNDDSFTNLIKNVAFHLYS